MSDPVNKHVKVNRHKKMMRGMETHHPARKKKVMVKIDILNYRPLDRNSIFIRASKEGVIVTASMQYDQHLCFYP